MSTARAEQSDAVYCANLVRASDFERYAATLFSPLEQRRALLALFAFNIEIARIREQISQPLAGEIRLQWWTDLLAGTGHGDAAANPVAAELLLAATTHALPRDQIARVIDAHRFDLYDEPMRTRQELDAYLQDTASTLFALAARILGGDPQADEGLAGHAGIAFGLARIVEALPRHASRGQFFLPLDEVEQAGVAPEDVLAGKSTPQLQAYLQGLATQARQHHARALDEMPTCHPPARTAFLPLALIDRKLRRIASSSYPPFDVQELSNLAVLWTLWRASRREPFTR